MYLNAIIFAKLQKLYQELDTDNDPYFLVFAPTILSFSNFDFDFLNPNVSSADEVRQNDENKMAFAQIANAIIRDPKIFQLNTDEMIQDAYSKILNNAILIDTTISDDDKAAYNNAKVILFVDDNFSPTPEYTRYKEIQDKIAGLDDQIIAINVSLGAGTPSDSQALLQQKQQLELQKNIMLNDWIINGNKNEIEGALKVVSGLNERGVFKNNFFNEILNLKSAINTETTVNSNIDYLPTFCLPQDIYQYDYNGWKKISMSSDEITAVENDAKAFLGDDIYNTYSSTSAAPVSKIEFEYIFVTIQRNWFKKDIINSSYWTFKADNTTIVSDGINENTGILPAFIDKFIFVRRIMQYLAPTPDSPPSETNTPVPAAYKFSEIAKLQNISMMKNIQPVHVEVSKIRLTNVTAQKQASPFIIQHNFTNVKAAAPLMAHNANNIVGVQKQMSFSPAGHVMGKIFLPNHFPVQGQNTDQPQQPTLFLIVFVLNDIANNALAGLDVGVTNVNSGTNYSALTDNTGKISFDGMSPGSYLLQVKNNEIYEDFENTYNINTGITITITLQKRANPKFDMWVIGAVNYQFPKLPNPLENYSYS